MQRCIKIGTRGSRLALVQAEYVAQYLRGKGCGVEIQVIATTGDRLADIPVEQIPERGIFVSAIEQALLRSEIDAAVHSMKDLPGQETPRLIIASVPLREDPRDVLIGRTAPTVGALPANAVIGTSSLRRRAELLHMRPDLQIADMRGNVDTRLNKLDAGQYDAICLAAAGLHRLGLQSRITQYFDIADMVPAPCQGALAVQIRQDDSDLILHLTELNDHAAKQATQIERYVLKAIGGGCTTPVGIHVQLCSEGYSINVACYSPTGSVLARLSFKNINGCAEVVGKYIVDKLHEKIIRKI